MRRSRGRLEQTTLALSAACLAIVATYGCRDATQVTLVLSTSKIACGALAGVRITVAGERLEAERRASGDFVTATATCPAPSSQDVGTLVITPGSSNSAAVVIVAGIGRDARSCNQANGYKGCVVARRSLSFIDHVSATVPVLIDPTCVDVPCDVASTCKRGTCVSAQLECKEDGSCEPTDPRARDGDASAPIDGASDGTAETDSGADALVDGSASDASEGGPSGACNFMCPDPMPPGQQCSGGQACCHALTSGGGRIQRCMSLAGCRAGGGNVQPGTAVCCSSTADCPNAVCCYESASDQTYCRAACGAGESRVCKSTMECNGCMSASRPPLYASLMVCPP